ncbi:hypothetical protein CPZ30_19390 [Paenibacillus lautus]|nr:hypothetical protein CPZ30_19390 [Paenibacillus lautus]
MERTFWVREHRKARLNSRFDAELLLDSHRVRYRIYKLSTELMKFYIARKPTSESRSLSLEFASIGFLIKSGLFEQPLEECFLFGATGFHGNRHGTEEREALFLLEYRQNAFGCLYISYTESLG